MVSLIRGAMLIVTLVCWCMSLYKLRDLTRDRCNRPLRALCLALVAITLSLTTQPVMPAIDQFVGVIDVTRLVSNCLTLISATAAQAFLLYMTGSDAPVRRQVRRRVVMLIVTLTAIVVLFVVTPPAASLSDPRVRSGEYYGDPFTAPFLYAYLAYLGWSMAQVVILAPRYTRITPRPLLRLGLRLITAGASVGLGYVAAKLVAVAAGALWPDSALITDAVVVTSFTVAILLILIGATIPSWGPRIGLDRVWSWAVALRDCYRLHPLWAAIHKVVPEIALLPAPSGTRGYAAYLREASLRRVRMTVEILDGYAALRPWMSGRVFRQAQVAAREAGLTGDRLAATTEAAVLAAALTYRHRGWPMPADADEVPLLSTDQRPADPVGGDHSGAAEQVSRLAQVARAYRSSAVAAVLAQLAPPPQPSERGGSNPWSAQPTSKPCRRR
jgi:hypothetical protein